MTACSLVLKGALGCSNWRDRSLNFQKSSCIGARSSELHVGCGTESLSIQIATEQL